MAASEATGDGDGTRSKEPHMSHNPLAARGMALEDLFFAREEAASRRRDGVLLNAQRLRDTFAEA